ncbi:S-adenosyl-L-methionine-dependent methyltransferase [Mycena polygramma]|nr:S-adenosyl-L-methionine-dependent methyltransferase [Mycena polygramma]
MKFTYDQVSEEHMSKMEEITGIPAKAMLVQSGLLPTPPAGALVLDNACGGGLLASLIFNTIEKPQATDMRVVCGDVEEAMVQKAKARIEGNGWNGEARVADAQALPFPDDHFTHNLMNFGIQLIPDATLVAKESFRVLKPGGKLGLTAWTAPGWLESFKLGVPGFVPPSIFTTDQGHALSALLAAAGFTHIEVQPVKFEHRDDMGRYLEYMRGPFTDVLKGEKGDGYDKYMRQRFGEGEFVLTWEAVVVTAEKE